jgi:hypothetical protein
MPKIKFKKFIKNIIKYLFLIFLGYPSSKDYVLT